MGTQNARAKSTQRGRAILPKSLCASAVDSLGNLPLPIPRLHVRFMADVASLLVSTCLLASGLPVILVQEHVDFARDLLTVAAVLFLQLADQAVLVAGNLGPLVIRNLSPFLLESAFDLIELASENFRIHLAGLLRTNLLALSGEASSMPCRRVDAADIDSQLWRKRVPPKWRKVHARCRPGTPPGNLSDGKSGSSATLSRYISDAVYRPQRWDSEEYLQVHRHGTVSHFERGD